MEHLSDYNSDRLFIIVGKEAGDADNWATIQASMIWKNMSAPKHNKVTILPSDKWLGYDILSIDGQLDEVAGLFKK